MARGDRTIGELLVLGVAVTICAIVLITVVAIAIIEIIDPDTDTSGPAGAVAEVISTLVGLLAGFLAGRTDRKNQP